MKTYMYNISHDHPRPLISKSGGSRPLQPQDWRLW